MNSKRLTIKRLTRRSVIHINTHQAASVTLTFIPGKSPYIHFDARHIEGFDRLNGFIDDKDAAKFKRFANSLVLRRNDETA